MNVAGITLTHPDRVLYPEQGITKADLARYYEAIGPWMLPHVANRPFSLVRCPAGRQHACFYQKHWSGRLPDRVGTVDIREGKGTVRPYTVVRDVAGLIALVQHGVLEFHVWGSRADKVELPDRVVFDVDPAPEVSWAQVKETADLLRQVLETLGLSSWLKTTGGKGLHVVIPLERRASWADVSAFARAVAERLAREYPDRYLAQASKAARRGKIFIDWLRNTRGATSVAAWSTRAREGAPVSVPFGWDELDELAAADRLGPREAVALARRRRKDPWASLLTARQRLGARLAAALRD